MKTPRSRPLALLYKHLDTLCHYGLHGTPEAGAFAAPEALPCFYAMPKPYFAVRSRPYSMLSTTARQLASMMFSETPTVLHTSPASA